jgi:hypothetical protein
VTAAVAENQRCRFPLAPIAVLVAIVVATAFLFPGDIPFINDEPLLIHNAWASNHLPGELFGIHLPFTLFGVDMAKTPRGLYYGPVATWVYQILLTITYNPTLLASLHALLLAGVTALALFWLAATLRVSAWMPAIVMLSPWLWIYHRMLWDNNLCIPLSALALASYADFLAKGRAISLRLAVFCAALLPLIHLMSLALVVPLAAHLILFQFRSLFKYKFSLLAILAIPNALAWQYWQYLLVFYAPVTAENLSPWRGWIFPLFGAQDLSAFGLANILGAGWYFQSPKALAYLAFAAQLISALVYIAVWIGIILAAVKTLNFLRAPRAAGAVDQIAAIALATLFCQIFLDGSQRVYGFPHYFNATWIAYAVFAFLAIQSLPGQLPRIALAVQGVSMLVVLCCMIFIISRDGGTRNTGFGTVLADQWMAAQKIAAFSPDSSRNVLFAQWKTFPGELYTLQDLLPPPPATRPTANLIIRYRNAFPGDARIEVESQP